MANLPSYSSVTVGDRRILADLLDMLPGKSVVLESANRDSGNSPTTRIRPGNVVTKRASSGEYVEATDANRDVHTAPSITSSGHTDGNGVIRLVGNHGDISVTTTTGTGTEANHVTDLNNDAAFARHYVASSGSGELTIAARNVGSQEWFYIHSGTMANASFAEGAENGAIGADPDVLVTAEEADVADENGTAQSPTVQTYRRGHFVEANLINLTEEAKAVLLARGCTFE